MSVRVQRVKQMMLTARIVSKAKILVRYGNAALASVDVCPIHAIFIAFVSVAPDPSCFHVLNAHDDAYCLLYD